MNLRDTYDRYRRAVAQVRDDSLSERAREKATDDMLNARHALDSAFVSVAEGAEAEAIAARAGAVRGIDDGRSAARMSHAKLAELRALVTPGSPTQQVWVTPPRELVIGAPNDFSGRRASAYITTDTATIGSAYYFTDELYQDVVTGLLDASGILEAQPTMIVTNHLRDVQVPVLTADAVAVPGTEGSPAGDANTEGSVVTLGAHRYDGKFSVSIEMLQASEYDLPGLLARFAVRAIANKTSAMLALGNGTTEPQGLFTAAAVTVGTTAAGTAAVTLDEMLACTKALSKGYRKGARLVTSDALHTALLQAKNGDGDYLLNALEDGGFTFAAHPWFTEPQADQSGMSAAEVHAVYGDFAGYFVRTSPMLFVRSDGDDPLNPTFHFAIWLDAKVADANALVSLKLHA